MSHPGPDDAFTIEKHGDVVVVQCSSILEHMPVGLSEAAASLILETLRQSEAPQLLVDLGEVQTFGSPFLAVLIRCWKTVTERGGSMVFARVSPAIRDLLKKTKFDTLWPLYDSRREAMEALIED
jgi:anti-anti-sigma factor